MTVSRLPAEAGVVWRLRLPRGEQVEAWEPGNGGLTPPDEIARLIDGVVAGKQLEPAPPLSNDPGAVRLREMIEMQRQVLLAHDPGTRLGDDPENLHQHRVAARRVRVYLRAARRQLDTAWRRSVAGPLRELGEANGPVRDLDVLLEHLRDELQRLEEPDRSAGDALLASLEGERDTAGRALLDAMDGDGYRIVLARLRRPPRLAPEVDVGPARAQRSQGVPQARRGRRAPRRSPRRGRAAQAPHRAQARTLRRRAIRPQGQARAAASSPMPGRCRTSSATIRTPSPRSSGCARSPSPTRKRRPRSSRDGSSSANGLVAHGRRSGYRRPGNDCGRAAPVSTSGGAAAPAPPAPAGAPTRPPGRCRPACGSG